MSAFNDRKRKVMQQDVDTDDKEERFVTQQPRAKFAAMDSSADQGMLKAGHQIQAKCMQSCKGVAVLGDLLDDEVPGSVRTDTATATAQDLLPPHQQRGAPLYPLLISITVLDHCFRKQPHFYSCCKGISCCHR